MEHTFDNTMVNVLDQEKLNAEFSEKIGEPVQFKGWQGFIDSPKHGVIDREMVIQTSDFTLDIFKADTKPEKGKPGKMHIMPNWSVKVDIDDLREYIKETVTLAEFTKERRGYNSRLIANESGTVRWLNEVSE